MKPASDSLETPHVEDTFGRGTNQGGMREANERVVLTILRRNPSITMAEIARATGLSAQTVTRLVGSLEADDLVLRGTPKRGRIGKPSTPLSLNPTGAISLGMKVGRRSAEMVAIDFLGEVLDRETLVYGYPSFDNVLDFALTASIRIQGRLPGRLQKKIAGLGVAMPFHLWNWAQHIGVESALMADWEHRDLRAEIADALDIPIFLQNDATAACSAEMVFGKAALSAHSLSIYIAFFVGGGLILNHSLYVGATGNAAGLGPFTIADRDGKARSLIELASLSVLERRLSDAGCDAQKLWTRPEVWDFPQAIVDAWCDECCQALASAIRSAQSLLDVHSVLIDGWLPKEIRRRIVEGVRAEFGRIETAGIAPPDIVVGSAGRDARTVGAASLPLSHRFMMV